MCSMARQMTGRSAGHRGPHPLPELFRLAWRQTGADRAALAEFLAGLARYQAAPLPAPRPAGRVLARVGTVRLIEAGGPPDGPRILLVPSIINGAEVLDLLPGHSLVEGLAARGLRVLAIDWGRLDGGERRLGLAGLVSTRLAPLARAVPGRFAMLGYCLGGTLAAGAAGLLPGRLDRLILLATPWRFSGYRPEARQRAKAAWAVLEPLGRQLGAIPLIALNPLFWSLDEAGVVAKYRAMGGDGPPALPLDLFTAVEDWANSGPALSIAAARDIFVHALGEDRMARGLWQVAGATVSLDQCPVPILEIGAARDRLVPRLARPAPGHGVRSMEIDAGHVGMIIGRRRAKLWDTLAFAVSND
jgi:polyhydroxyalkanoate synthase